MRNHIKCYACIHLMNPNQSADGVRRCRIDGGEVNPAREADCRKFVREVGSDDSVPEWYRDAWVCDSQGRGD